jgi:lipoprotein NlpI
LQFVAIGPALFNERYALIPAIGLSYAIAFYFIRFKDRYPRFHYPMLGVLGIYLMVMFVLTFRRCDVWKDSLTLWDDVLAQYPDASMALNNRGRIYGSELGNTTKALEDLNRAIISDPANAQAYSNRGIVFCMNGKFGQAINDFNRAIHLKKDYYEAFANRGIAFAQTNRPDSALADFDRCLELSPDKPAIYLNRGMCFYQLGKYREAYDDIMKAMSAGLNPDPAWLKQLEAQLGKTDTPANPK